MFRLALLLAVALLGCRSPAPVAAPSAMPASQAAPLAVRLDAIVNRLAHTGAIVGVHVVDLGDDAEVFARDAQVFAHDADRPLIPASNMKTLVTAVAVDALGPGATFETDLLVVGEDLYLVGGGDPALGDAAIAARHGRAPLAAFDAWADELRALGRTAFAGNLYYVDGAFERQQLHPSWSVDPEDLNEWYGAPVGGLNLNGNSIELTATPAAAAGEPPTLDVWPPTAQSVVIVNDAVTDRAGEPTIDWSRATNQNLYTVAGTIARRATLRPKPVTDPGAFCADALRTHLSARGIAVAGGIVRADAAPARGVVTLRPAVTRVLDVIARVNKNSQNPFAEGVAKKLGLEFARRKFTGATPVGSWANAEAAVRDHLSRRAIDARGLAFADGSGLSRDNRLTARLLTDVLAATHRGPHFAAFRDTLSVAGVDGTMKGRLTDAPGRAFLKTGYMNGVRTMAGYVRTDAGRWRAFAILHNAIPGQGLAATRAFEAAQDDAVRAMMGE